MNKRGSKFLDLVEQIKKDFPVSNYASEETAKAIWAAKVKSAIAEINAGQPEDLSGTNPMGIEVEVDFDKLRAEAEALIKANREDKLLVSQFVRPGKRELAKTITDVEAGKVYKKFKRNAPVGALVAFLVGDTLLIGWSKYNEAKQLVIEAEGKKVLKNKESLPFSKKTAVLTGVMRGLVDKICPNGKDNYMTGEDKHIPKAIAKDMAGFVERVEKYFGRQAVNVGRFQGTG